MRPAEELGEKLGVPSHLNALVRTKVGGFDLEAAVPDDSFDRLAGMDDPGVGMADALSHLPSLELDDVQLAAVTNGQAPRSGSLRARPGEFVRLLDSDGRLRAIAEAGPADLMKLKRVFAAGGTR